MDEKTDPPLADYCRLYTRAAAAFDKAQADQGGYVSDDMARAALEAASCCLRAYLRPKNFTSDGSPIEHLPPEIIAVIADWLGVVLSGKVPQILQHVARAGAPSELPRESESFGWAVAYIKECKANRIMDRAPVQTVATKFGVADRTVRRWQADKTWATPEDFFPGLSEEDRAALIAAKLDDAAKLHRRDGRSEVSRREHPRPGKRQVGI